MLFNKIINMQKQNYQPWADESKGDRKKKKKEKRKLVKEKNKA